MIDLSSIPAERLALLDCAVLFHGSHAGGPDCQHCARELLHEVVTGTHRDATPPGGSVMMAILPYLNDGPWRDDAHRTEVMRPYLRRMLALDPAHDEARIYALIDHVYRKKLPDICDALKLDKHGSALRDLAPIIDRKSALAARVALATLDALAAIDALAALAAFDAFDAIDAIDALDAIAAFDAIDALAALAALDAFDAFDAIDAIDALDAIAAFDAFDALAARAVRAVRAAPWESGVRELLDLICNTPPQE